MHKRKYSQNKEDIMDLKESLENLTKAIFEADHQLNTSKAALALLQELNPALFHKIMEKLNLV